MTPAIFIELSEGLSHNYFLQNRERSKDVGKRKIRIKREEMFVKKEEKKG